MYHGGAVMNKQTMRIIRIVNLFVPIILLLFGLLIFYGFVAGPHDITAAALFGTTVPWVVIAGYQLLRPPTTKLAAGIQLVAYHLLAISYVLLVSGFMTPVVIAWVLLLLASYSYFSRAGIHMSIYSLIAAAAVDIALQPDISSTLASDGIVVATLLVTSLTVVQVARAQEVDSAELVRSKAQESLQRDRMLTIVNNLADAVLSTDENGLVQIYNAASLNLLDTNNSLIGQHINDVVSLVDKDGQSVDLFADLKTATSVNTRDDVTVTIEDETMRLEVTYSPIRSSYSRSKKSESQDGYILIMRDVTKAKSLEEERDEFISVVSHELRTPITIAEGTISNVLLMMERDDISSDRLPAAILTAHDQVLFLAKMVNDLSTLSRAERGVADEAESIDVKQLAQDVFNEYSPHAEEKNLHLNLDIDSRMGHVLASRLYLKELLQNFTTNSIKYTKEGSITLRVTQTNGEVTFAVQDTGIGMSKSDQAKIFNKFYRSEDYRTRETGGTGLGLYVATKLAAKLGTTIRLDSRLNYGSTFSFTLPIEK